MNIKEKIKAITNKINQNKSQYDFNKQNAKISALSPGNVNKYEFLTAKMCYWKKPVRKKLQKSKDLNILHLVKELK